MTRLNIKMHLARCWR